MSKIRFIGLDVHADTIAVAVAEPGGEVRSVGTIPKSGRRLAQSHGEAGLAGADSSLLRSRADRLRRCTGDWPHWESTAM